VVEARPAFCRGMSLTRPGRQVRLGWVELEERVGARALPSGERRIGPSSWMGGICRCFEKAAGCSWRKSATIFCVGVEDVPFLQKPRKAAGKNTENVLNLKAKGPEYHFSDQELGSWKFQNRYPVSGPASFKNCWGRSNGDLITIHGGRARKTKNNFHRFLVVWVALSRERLR